MDDLESRLRASLAARSQDSVDGAPVLPPVTRRRARLRRGTSAASALLVIVIVSTGVTAVMRGNDPGRIDPAATPSDGESTLSSEVPSPGAASPGASPAIAAYARRTILRDADVTGMFRAHGDIWVRAQKGNIDRGYESILYRLSPAGTLRTTIHLERFLPSVMFGVFEDGPDGIWIAGTAETVTATRAIGRCSAVARTGPVRHGSDVLLHLNAQTNCPTVLVEFEADEAKHPWPAPGEGSRVVSIVRSIAAIGEMTWIGSADGLHSITPDGTVTLARADITRHVVAAFGALWTSDDSNGGSVIRLDPSDAADVARIAVKLPVRDFGFGHGTVWVFGPRHRWTGAVSEGTFYTVRINPSTNLVVADADVKMYPEYSGVVSVADKGSMFIAAEAVLTRFDPRSNIVNGRISFVTRDRSRWVMGTLIVDDTLWVSVSGLGVIQMDPARERWLP